MNRMQPGIAQAPDPSQRMHHVTTMLILLVGDTAMFIVFAAVGRSSHGEPAGFVALLDVLKTAAPFLVGWFVAAPFAGAYRVDDLLSPAATPEISEQQDGALGASSSLPKPSPYQFIRRTAVAWSFSWPLGLAIRGLMLWRGIPMMFAIVTYLTNLLLLVAWRTLFAVILTHRSSQIVPTSHERSAL